jgi:high-affinity Fe2+/Pb2+ permease
MTDIFTRVMGWSSRKIGAVVAGDWPVGLAPPDDQSGMLGPIVAGAVTALVVAIVVTIYLRSGYRSPRDVVRGFFVTAVVLGFVGFVAYDIRHAALDYLGISSATASTRPS